MVAITFDPNKRYEGTMPFRDLLSEVMKLKIAGKNSKILSNAEQGYSYKARDANAKKNQSIEDSSLIVYGLDGKRGSAYFTRREAQCMVLLLKGKTINSIANILKLSPRTVEYYIKNMKFKVGCRTKFELVDLVHASDFTKNVKL